MIRKGLAQRTNAVQAFGEDQRRSCFEPIDTGADSHPGEVERFVNVGQV